MIFVKVFLVLSCSISVAIAGGETFCEPFKSIYNDFLMKFQEALDKRKSMIVDNIYNFPFYADAAKNESRKTLSLYLDFFVNATARLSSLDVGVVRSVVKGELKPIPHPLSCFPKVFDQLEDYIDRLINQTIDIGLQVGSSSSSSDQVNCMSLHASQLQIILNEREALFREELETFPEFADFVNVIRDVQKNQIYQYFVAAFAETLHLTVDEAKLLINGNFTDLSMFLREIETTPLPDESGR